MGVDLVLRQVLGEFFEQLFAHLLRVGAGSVVDGFSEPPFARSGQAVRNRIWKELACPVGEFVLGPFCDDPCRRALQHGDMRSGGRHRRHERDGGGRTDHHDPLVAVVEVLWPLLRVNDLTPEVIRGGNSGVYPPRYSSSRCT